MKSVAGRISTGGCNIQEEKQSIDTGVANIGAEKCSEVDSRRRGARTDGRGSVCGAAKLHNRIPGVGCTATGSAAYK